MMFPMWSTRLALALLTMGCLTYRVANKPDKPDGRVMFGIGAAEVGVATLAAISYEARAEKNGDSLGYIPTAMLSLGVIIVTDVIFMFIVDSADSSH